MDIGGTKIAAARVTRNGDVSNIAAVPTPSAGGLAVVEAVVDLLEQTADKDIGTIGVDVPGLAYPGSRVWAPNIPDWQRMPLGAALKKRFRLPAIVESARNAFVVDEVWQGVARNRRDVVFLAIGTGIGAGILSGGYLLRGHGEVAESIGWMAPRDRFLPIYQKIDCFEAHTSGTGIGLAASRHFRTQTHSAPTDLDGEPGKQGSKIPAGKGGTGSGYRADQSGGCAEF